MNIELEEVVVQDVSDDALELAAGRAQGVNPLGVCAIALPTLMADCVSYC